MIIFDGVTKIAGGDGGGKRPVLMGVQARLPSDQRIAVLSPEPGDKKIFMDLLGGLGLPNAGRIIRQARIGFPPGHLGGFTTALSVRQNVAHVARLYSADVDTVVDFVAKVAALGESFKAPFGDLPVAKRKHLSEILAFSIPFDVYLVNEDLVHAGSKRYSAQASALFEARAKTSGMFIASESADFIRQFCDMGLVLLNGSMRLFRDVEEAIAFSKKVASVRPAGKREKRKIKNARREEEERPEDL